MLSSHKIFYLVVISMLILCTMLGISVQGSNTYVVLPKDENAGPDNIDQYQELSFQDEDEGHSGFFDSGDGEGGSDSTSMDVDVTDDESKSSTSGFDISQGGISELETQATTTQSETTTKTGRTEQTTTTTTAAQDETPTTAFTVPTTTTTVFVPPTTTTTTTTTTAYIPPTTAPTEYYNTDRISFAASPGGATVTEYRVYAGNSFNLYLNTTFGETPIASYFSDNTGIATITSDSVGVATVYANSVGDTWVHAYNANGEACHCKIVVADYESQIVYLCNQYRIKAGLTPLEVGPSQLKSVADVRLGEIYSKWSHTRPDGSKFSTAYPQNGIYTGKFGENLARGEMYTPEDVVRAWMNSASHRANIMNGSFRYCSVSYGDVDVSGATWRYWSQQFYTPYY